MELSGICGTDKHIFSGEGHLYAGTEMETQAAFPLIPGHENVGIVEELGARRGGARSSSTASRCPSAIAS